MMHRLMVLILTSLLAACGSGGGSNNRGSGANENGVSITANTSNIILRDYLYLDNRKDPKYLQKASITVQFNGDGVVAGVIKGQEEALKWLTIIPRKNTTTSADFDINVFNIPTTIPYHQYQTTLRFATGKGDGNNIKYLDVPFNALFGDYFYTNKDQISLSKFAGNQYGDEEILDLFASKSKWRIGTKPAWLEVSPVEGEGDKQLSLKCNSAADSLARTSGILTIEDTSIGLSRQVMVSCESNPTRVTASKYGVALTQLKNASKLTQELSIGFSGGSAGEWEAQSGQKWLNITASGNQNTPLLLTVNPIGLTDDSMHYADINLNKKGDAEAVVIHLGFYKNTQISLDGPINLPIKKPYLFADPIRPYVYYNDFDITGASTPKWKAFNIYTGKTEKTYDYWNNCLDLKTISPDGSKLYWEESQFCKAKGIADKSTKIFKLDLMRDSEQMQLLVDIPFSDYRPNDSGIYINAIINNSIPAIIAHPGYIYHGDTGQKLANFLRIGNIGSDGVNVPVAYQGLVRATSNGNRFFIMGFIRTDIYNLFIPSTSGIAQVKKVKSFQADDLHVNGSYINKFFIRSDGNLVKVPSACVQFNDGIWKDSCSGDISLYNPIVEMPDGRILATTTSVYNFAFLDKDLNFLAYEKSLPDMAYFDSPLVSADGLMVLTYFWDNIGLNTEVTATPYKN